MTEDYQQALEDLDRMRAAGQVSQAQYDLHRTKLLAEATKRPRVSKVWAAVLIVCAMIAVWLLFMFISRSIAP